MEELGNGDICSQCRGAIKLLCRKASSPSVQTIKATEEFLEFCLNEEVVVREWREITNSSPQLIWSQAQSRFPTLSGLLMKVYASPASSAGVERQHKVAKRIHTPTRNRLGPGKVEAQTAIAHNAAVAKFNVATDRQRFEKFMVVTATGGGLEASSIDDTSSDIQDEEFELTEGELAEQEALSAAIYQLPTHWQLPDQVLFPIGYE
jgi:hypothetical protein